MPPTLRVNGDELRLKLAGLPGDAFKDALAKAKALAGGRYDPEAKEWVYPLSADNAQRLVHTITLEAEPEVLDLIRKRASEVAAELTSRLPEDGILPAIGWSDQLYPYQRAGISHLVKHPHAILADDMGLGKTVEAISAVYEADLWTDPIEQPALVICPNTLKLNWKRELARWAEIDSVVVGGSKGKREKQLATPSEWYIINWELLRLHPELAKREWSAVIADEAHRAKNRKAQQTKALWKLHAPMQLALTGTPILNSPDELWAILKWLDPQTYTSYWRFYEQHVYYYEGYYGRVITGVRNPDELRFALRDTLVRRTKGQVLKDLPAKLPPQTIEVELLPEQRRLYNDIETELVVEIERAVEAGEVEAYEVADRIKARDWRGLTLLVPNAGAKIARQRQVIASPALIGGKDKSAKLDVTMELLSDAPDKQFVVFTHHKGAADLLVERLQKASKNPDEAGALTGDTPLGEREALVQRFQAGEVRVIVCTIMAGGQGITLTAADTAIFVEREWTPAYNTQAEDRLHRIGQESPVRVIRLDAVDTLDTGRIAPANRLKDLIVTSVLGDPA